LNETYKGGMGSYLCFLTVLCVVLRSRRLNATSPDNLGALLLQYFEFFGNILNYDEVGISLLKGGSFFLKKDRNWDSPERPYLLCLEDPVNPTNDIGRNSFGILTVKRAFAIACLQLKNEIKKGVTNSNPIGGALASIIKLSSLGMPSRAISLASSSDDDSPDDKEIDSLTDNMESESSSTSSNID